MNYYQVLDIPPDASPEDIKRAYRRLARKHHPDVAGAESGDRFHQVQLAYEILSDPGARRKYDLSVGWGRSPRTAIPYRPARPQSASVSQTSAVKQTVRPSPPRPPQPSPPRPPAAERPVQSSQSGHTTPKSAASAGYAPPQSSTNGIGDRGSTTNGRSQNGIPKNRPHQTAAPDNSPKQSKPFTPPPPEGSRRF